MPMNLRICPCGSDFIPLTSRQVYCTPDCTARPRQKPAQRADAVTRAVPVRRSRGGPRGPQGSPKCHRLRMNFTNEEIERLTAAAAIGCEHPADFARRAINTSSRVAAITGKTRTLNGIACLLPDGDWWFVGWRGVKLNDVHDCLEQDPIAIFEFELVVPVDKSFLVGSIK